MIHEGDCLDILRCVNRFQAIELESLKDATKEMREDIINLIKNSHALLYQQGDLLFDCKLYIGRDELQTHFHGSRHLLKEKVKIEHSNNVYIAMLKNFYETPCFKQFFQNTDLKFSIRIDSPEPKFVPFLHGTNSSVLTLLSLTQFKFLSPVTMMQKFGIAPLSGEISLGGLAKPESDGRMCFGRLDTKSMSQYDDPYTRYKIWSKYSKIEFTKPSLEKLPLDTKYLIDDNFNSINEFMILITRARMWGLDVYKNNPMLSEITFHFNRLRQYFYLILCISKHLEINPQYVDIAKKASCPQDNLMHYYFTDETVYRLISKSECNFENLWNNPTLNGMEKLIIILNIPQSFAKQYCSDPTKLDIVLNSKLFIPIQKELKEKKEKKDSETGSLWSSKLNSLLEIACTKGSDKLKENIPFLLNRLSLLDKKFEILLSILNRDSRAIELSSFQKYCIQKSFPLLLISESEDNIELIDFSSREYRASCDLTLGKEITAIAVETNREKMIVESFVEKHQIPNVTVLLNYNLHIGERPTLPSNALKPLLSPHLPKKPAELVYMYLSNCSQSQKLTLEDVYLKAVHLKKSLHHHRKDFSWQNELNYYLAAKQLKHLALSKL